MSLPTLFLPPQACTQVAAELPLAGVAKFGAQKLTLESDTFDLGPVTVFDGELLL